MSVILGLDLSLTKSGYCILEDGDIIDKGTIIPKKVKGMERLDFIVNRVLDLVHTHYTIDLVAIEGYSFGSRGGRAFSIGENGGVVKHELWKMLAGGGIEDIIIIPPKSLKKFTCGAGKGNAKKDMMMLKAYKKYGIEFSDDDECDAFCLTKMGQAYLEGTEVTYEKECLTKVEVLV